MIYSNAWKRAASPRIFRRSPERCSTSASLAAGLGSPDDLVAIAVADWNRYRRPSGSAGVSVQQVFAERSTTTCSTCRTGKFVADALLMHYFSFEEQRIDELIVATTRLDISTLVHRVQTTDRARVRIWGDEPPARPGKM